MKPVLHNHPIGQQELKMEAVKVLVSNPSGLPALHKGSGASLNGNWSVYPTAYAFRKIGIRVMVSP